MKTAFVGCEQEDWRVYNQISKGEVKLVYFSPETLLTVPHWIEMSYSTHNQCSVVCLAVNEACLVEIVLIL